jgi:hypothetical protein
MSSKINTDKETYNLYFKTDEIKENVFKGASSSEKYILLANETLQKENRDLSSKIKNLENNIGELQEEIDGYDNSKRYTKGLLKNLVELEKLRNNIAIINKDITKLTNKNIIDYQSKIQKYIYCLYAFMFSMVAVLWEFRIMYNFDILFLILIIVINLSFIQTVINKFSTPLFEDKFTEINSTQSKIDTINRGQDYLCDLVDMI